MKLAIYKKRVRPAEPAAFSPSWSLTNGGAECFALAFHRGEDKHRVHVTARFTRGEIESLIATYHRMLADHPRGPSEGA